LLSIFLAAAAALAQNGPAALQAAGRGGPWLNLRDGRPVHADYGGDAEAASALTMRQAQPLSLASADFDEDGVPDLIAGYSLAGGSGAVALYRGNIDALWPYGKGEPSAFLPGVRAFRLPAAPDFLGAGDFNADGHWDVVAARRGSGELWFLFGDGHGGFGEPVKVDLPEAVTALATGEMNRRDGLTDVVVGVANSAQAEALVFESPTGAARAEPEAFDLPAPAAGFAMGNLERGGFQDLIIAAGHDLIAVRGRDRRLSLEKSAQAKVPSAKISRQTVAFELAGIALGAVSDEGIELAALGRDEQIHMLRTASGARWNEIGAVAVPGGRALVAGHVSAAGAGDFLVLASDRIHVVSPAPRKSGRSGMELAASLEVAGGSPAAVLPMRLNQHPLSGIVMLNSSGPEPRVSAASPFNTFTVTNTSDSGAGSLRQAITDANAAQGASLIDFNIPTTDPNRDPATGAFRISPIVDDANQIGPYINALPDIANIVTIDGYTQPGASPNTDANGQNATILIELNGTQEAQSGALPGGSGLGVSGYGIATIRGFAIDQWTSRAFGGFLTPANPCYGPTGVVSDGECSDSNAGSGGDGIVWQGCGGFIEGNFIGTDVTGTMTESNIVGIVNNGGFCGVTSLDLTIGGTTPQARNIISGNYFTQIGIAGLGTIQGNFIGTDKTGANGLMVQGSRGVTCNCGDMLLGGTAAGAGNVISGNGFLNVHINGLNCDITDTSSGEQICDQTGYASGALVEGNIIGADVTGTKSVTPHNGPGIRLQEAVSNNTIGGTTPAARNIISGNQTNAIEIADAAFYNTVQGNYIGVDITGTKPLGQGDGINTSWIQDNSPPGIASTIGGAVPGAGNIIGNGLNGIEIIGDAGDPDQAGLLATNYIQGNFIGTDPTGTLDFGNKGAGVWLEPCACNSIGASDNIIGGTDLAARNLIAFNGFDGIDIDPGAAVSGEGGTPGNNQVTGNVIFSNSLAGVRIGSGIQNTVSRNSIYANGQLGIDFNLGSANDNFGGSCQTNTNPPNGQQNAPVLTGPGGAEFVSATATDPHGNTSMFSNCAAFSGNSFNVPGTLNSTPNTNFTIEFYQTDSCDASGFGQGKTFLGSEQVTTGSNCVASFNQAFDLTGADLSVTLNSAATLPAYLGNPALGTIAAVVTNNGTITAHNVTVTDTLPGTLSLSSVAASVGSCGNSGNAITCSLGTIPSGESSAIAIQYSALTADSVTNTMTVTATETDPDTANNTLSVPINPQYLLPAYEHTDPPSVAAGSADISLNLYGANFVAGVTAVTFNGTPLQVTGLATVTTPGHNFSFTGCDTRSSAQAGNCQQLTVSVPANLLTTAATPTITTTNPPPGGSFDAPDRPFTIISGACSYSVSPNSTQNIGNGGPVGGLNYYTGDGGTLSFNVTASPSTCTWSNSANVPWLVPQNPGDFKGNSFLTYHYLPNAGAARTGTITIAGQQITVNQAGGLGCYLNVSASSELYPAAGGSGQVGTVETPEECLAWTAGADVPWVTITSGASSGMLNSAGNSANAVISYAVAANSGLARTGHINVTNGGTTLATFTVNQAGLPGPCDVNQDGSVNVTDVQQMINEALGAISPANDLDGDRILNVVDVQIDINAALQLGCSAS